MGFLFGGSQQETKTKVPGYIEQGGKAAVGLAQKIADQPYKSYSGNRVAPRSRNQIQASHAAHDLFEEPQSMIRSGFDLAQSAGGRQWDQGAAQQYMNPFVQSALDPAIRRINEEAQQNAIGGRAGMIGQGGIGAFGDARTAVMEGEMEEARLRGVGDTLATGYANAYDRALQEWGATGDRQMRAADLMGTQGGRLRATGSQGIQDLLTTGGQTQQQQQRRLDTKYGDFIEQRDWAQRGLDAYTRALSGTPYSTTQSGNTGESVAQQVGGLGLAGVGLWKLFS